jgi:amino acid transporter
MHIKKPERLVGYALLTVGLIIILASVVIAILLLLGNMALIQYIPQPVIAGSGSDTQLAQVIADLVPLFNVIPTFLLFVVLIYAGSVLMGKGVGLIKEINWTAVGTTREAKGTEPEKTEEPELKPAKRGRKERAEE